MSITEAGQGPLFPSLSKNLKYKETQINSNWNYFTLPVSSGWVANDQSKDDKKKHLWKSDRYHQNSNGKSGIYDHRELEECVRNWLQQRPTTGNSDVADAETGNAYIARIMTDRVEISTANPGLWTTASSIKVSRSDYDNDRYPEVTVWQPKPEIFISLALWQKGSKFQRQIWSFRPHRAWKTSPGNCDNYRHPDPEIAI